MVASSDALDARIVQRTPYTISERALEELRSYYNNHAFQHGDIMKVAQKYGLNYNTLQSKWRREIHDLNGGAFQKPMTVLAFKKKLIDVHGKIFRHTSIPQAMLEKLPFRSSKCAKTKLRGFTAKDVSLNAFGDGKVEVFEKDTNTSRTTLTNFFKANGWSDEWVALFYEALDRNYQNIHVACYDPDADQYENLPMSFKDDAVKVIADNTPFTGKDAEGQRVKKTLEVMINMKDIDILRGKMDDLLGVIKPMYQGNVSIATSIIQMQAQLNALSQQVYDLQASKDVGIRINASSDVQTNTTKPPSCMDPPLEPFAQGEKPRENAPVKGSNPIQSVNQEEKQGGASVPGSHFSSPPISREQSTTGDCIVVDPKRTPSNLDKSPGSPPETFTEKFHQKPPEECPYIQKQKDGTYLCVTDSAKIIMQKGCWSNGFQPCFKEFTTCPDWKRIAG